MSIQTGYDAGGATTAEVFIVLIGSDGQSAPRRLHNPNGQCFMRGETNVFLLAFPYGFGQIKEIQVWHNNMGDSPGWFFLRAQVYLINKKTLFRKSKVITAPNFLFY